jgi:hypothetical protein
MDIICRFTHDIDSSECYAKDKFKFVFPHPKLGVPGYYLDRLCKIKSISREKEVIFFFFDEPLTIRKISTLTFNKCCQKHLL